MGRKVCKRCDKIPRYDDSFHRGLGARSRVADINICSDCGVQEALEDFMMGAPTPRSEWPVVK